MFSRTWQAAVLAALLVAAPGAAEPSSDGDYYPLGEGARWEYESIYEMRGLPDVPAMTGRRVERIEGSEEHAGQTYLRFVSTLEGLSDQPVSGRSLLRVGDEGILVRADPNAPEALVLPLPATIGRTWSWKDAWGTWQGKIERALEVETPAGHFDDCIEVTVSLEVASAQARGRVHRLWNYCRGVGPVRQVTTAESPGPNGPIAGVTEEKLTRAEPPDSSR